jgi:hypothetical protein
MPPKGDSPTELKITTEIQGDPDVTRRVRINIEIEPDAADEGGADGGDAESSEEAGDDQD